MFFPHIITCLQMHVMVSTIPKKKVISTLYTKCFDEKN